MKKREKKEKDLTKGRSYINVTKVKGDVKAAVRLTMMGSGMNSTYERTGSASRSKGAGGMGITDDAVNSMYTDLQAAGKGIPPPPASKTRRGKAKALPTQPKLPDITIF